SKSSESKESKSSKSSKSEGGGSGEVLKVGGESFSVGDEITCVYSVTCPDSFINFQATLNYDSSVLKATGAKMQGDASSGSVVNYKLDGKVKFNGINLAGYDYTDGGKFMYVTYEVIGSGSTSPEISWEIVTDEKNNPMVVNGDIKSSFKISESWE
ncbi:MAG: cohesin domain-containing protein, partial [Ruminococcus sp.]|nr:cohesin domain-containing protein [Ruminococcus sp.]